jgi:Tfp pilus assembly protein PilO
MTQPRRHDADEQHTTGAQTRERLTVVRSARRAGPLGLAELGALAVAALLLLTTVAAYFFYLRPQRTRLEELGRERAQLETRLRAETAGVEQINDTQANVTRIVDSIARFETGTLAAREAASAAIVEELNQKTARNNLARAQFSFTHQEELTGEQLQQQQQRLLTGGTTGALARKRQSIFPGIDISLTVEGPYGNVRRFVRDVEASRNFIVINGVELESVTDASAQRAAESGATRGQLVALRLDLSAYFRRAGGAIGVPDAPTQ